MPDRVVNLFRDRYPTRHDKLQALRNVVWDFATLMIAVIALVRAGHVANEAQRDSVASCERAKVVIPIQIKALTVAERAGVVTQRDLADYRAAYPQGAC